MEFRIQGPLEVLAGGRAVAINENAWLLGLVAVREQRSTTQREVGLVRARGVAPRTYA
jgi:hypothetical protein